MDVSKIKKKGGIPPIKQKATYERRAAQKFTRETYELIQHKVSRMTLQELKTFIREPQTTVLEAAVAAVWAKAIGKGDIYPLEKFTNRMAGPVRKEVSVTGMSFADLVRQQAELAKADKTMDLDDDGDSDDLDEDEDDDDINGRR